MPLAVLWASQVIWEDSFSAPIPWMTAHGAAVGLFWVLFFLLSLALYGVFRRLFWALFPGALFCCVLTWVSRCKMNVNGAPLQLSDFSFLENAGDIAGFAVRQLLPSPTALCACLLLLLLLGLLAWWETWRVPAPAAFLVGSFAMVAFILSFSAGPLPAAAAGLDDNCRDQLDRCQEQGVVLGLYTAWAQRVRLDAATTDADVLQLAEDFRQDAALMQPPLPLEETPDIIFITSESFFDLTRLPNLSFDRDPLPVFHRLSKTCTNGRFLTNTYGGGTGYVEMEIFTGLDASRLREGDTLSTLESSVYDTLPTMVRHLQKLGYDTTAVHAHTDALYNRRTLYPAIGFDEMLFLEDFIVPPEGKGPYISDESLVEELITRYQRRDKSAPYFLYGLSMENHQAYFPGKFSESSGYPAESPLLNDEDLAILDSYVVGLRDADAALGRLVDYFSRVDRPVILVFVGDHLPSLNLSDGVSIYTRLGASPSEHSHEWDAQTLFDMLSTDYLIWTNFQEGTQPDRTESCTLLGLHLLQQAGLPLNEYYTWLKEVVASQLLFVRNRLFVDTEGTPFCDSTPAQVQGVLDLYTQLEQALIYHQK